VASALGPTGTKIAAGEPAESPSGIVGETQQFDGTDDQIDFGASVLPAGFVLEAFCQTTTKDNNVLVSWITGDICAINWSMTGRPILWRAPGNYRYWTTAAKDLIGDGNWHHVAFLVPGNDAADIDDAELLVDNASQTPYHTSTFPGSTWTEKHDAIRAWLKFTWANLSSPDAQYPHELLWGAPSRPGGVGFHSAVVGAGFSTGATIGGVHLPGAVAGATDGQPIVPDEIGAVHYSVFLLDDADADARTPVEGHSDVALASQDVLFDTPQNDALWEVDELGYNFRHELDVSQHPAFAIAGRRYLVEYRLQPVSGQRRYLVEYRLQPVSGQVIVVRFRIDVI